MDNTDRLNIKRAPSVKLGKLMLGKEDGVAAAAAAAGADDLNKNGGGRKKMFGHRKK